MQRVVGEDEVRGVNTRSQLSEVEAILQTRLGRRAMDEGATLLSPETVTFSHDTMIGQDVVIEPNVFFGPGVVIEDGVTINGFCHIDRCTHRAGCECCARSHACGLERGLARRPRSVTSSS